jgi:hypothetical protein
MRRRRTARSRVVALQLAAPIGQELIDQAHPGWHARETALESHERIRTTLDHQPTVLNASNQRLPGHDAEFPAQLHGDKYASVRAKSYCQHG